MKKFSSIFSSIQSLSSVLAIVFSIAAFIEVSLTKELWESMGLKQYYPVLIIVLISGIVFGLFYEYLNKIEKTVFVIYSHSDKDITLNLVKHLKESKYNVILDDDFIKPGEDISQKINEAISKSEKFILVVSPDAISSEWINIEVNKVLKTNKKVIPLIVKEIEKLPEYLKNIKYLDISGKKDSDTIQSLSKFVDLLN